MKHLFSLLPLLACGGPGDSSPETTDTAPDCTIEATDASPLDLTGRPECGAIRYAQLCATCHADDGSGTELGPDLAGHVPFHSDALLVVLIQSGPGDMDPYDLEAQDMADLLAHLRAWYPLDTTGTHP